MKKFIFAVLFFIPIISIAQELTQEENLVLLPSQKDPTVSVRIMFYAGSRFDPAGKEGISALTASLLSDGSTQTNAYPKILELLYHLAASYNASPSVEVVTFSGRMHKDNIEAYYPLFMDALLKPAFNEDDFKRIKSNMLNYLTTTLKYSSDEELGKAVLYNEIFSKTPYGHLISGTISGLNNINIDDVKNFYHQYYNKNNFILGIGGGYSQDFVQRISDDLSTLPDGKKSSLTPINPKPLNGLEVTIIDKKAQATAISMGFPIDILRGQKEWYALAVANSWLGEHRNSSSHLYQVIREERGLNYGDYSYIENFPQGGQRQMPPVNVPRTKQIFEIWIRPVPNETRHFSVRAALREFDNLVEKGMNKEDFELTKNFLSKYVLHYAPSTEERLGYAMDDRFYGMKESHLELFTTYLKDMKLEDVNDAIKKYWQTGNMEIAVITEGAELLKNSFQKDEASPIKYTTPKPESVLKEDEAIISYPLKIKEENIKILKVEDLFK